MSDSQNGGNSEIFATGPLPQADQRTYSVIMHVASLFFPFLAPLAGYLMFRKRGEFIGQHCRAALNFQITVILACVLLAITIIGALVIWVVLVYAVVQIALAIVAASKDQPAGFKPNLNLIHD